MPLLFMAFLAGVVFLGGVAVFLGGIVMLTSWNAGVITLNYEQDGKPVIDTISRVTDSARFWQLYTLMGIVPAVLGAAAAWYGIRTLRRS